MVSGTMGSIALAQIKTEQQKKYNKSFSPSLSIYSKPAKLLHWVKFWTVKVLETRISLQAAFCWSKARIRRAAIPHWAYMVCF